MIQVKVKKLHPDAVLPKKATPGSAGFDLYAVEEATIIQGHLTVIPTGLAIEVPPGYELQIRPRSGLAAKYGVSVINSPGTVDSDYRGEVKVILGFVAQQEYQIIEKGISRHFGAVKGYRVEKGSRIAQGVIAPIPQVEFIEVEDLSETSRGTGGFGSTGV